MEKDKVIQYIKEVIKEKIRHQDYKRVTELAKKYYTYFSGEGLDEELKQFTPREEEELFIQRKSITKHIVTSIVSNVVSVEKKVPRSNGITKFVGYEKKNKDSTQELEKALGRFWGTQSWEKYMEVRWVELNDVDPNTFVIFEWGTFDPNKELLQPYPFEANAHAAIDFEIKNNIIQYLTVLNEIELKKEGEKDKLGEKYNIYLPNETITVKELWDDAIKAMVVLNQLVTVIGGVEYFLIEDRLFEIIYHKPHNQGYVPVFRAGWKRDSRTNSRTFLAPWDAAMPYLEKIVKANSEMDLTMALHTFPQKVVTVPKCDNPDCYGGVITLPDGQTEKCPHCKGEGVMVHRSGQDIITVAMPKSGEEQLSLENIIRYIVPPIDLPTFQDLYIEKKTKQCMSTVYNSDIFTRSEVAATATEKRIDLDNVYDTLFPMSAKYSDAFKFGVRTIAKLIDRETGLIVVHSFSKDFKFKSKDDYIADRAAAVTAEAPATVLSYIDREIIRIDTADDPDGFRIHEMMGDFNPFEGKSNDEIRFIISSGLVPNEQIILYTTFGFIFDEITLDDPSFWEKDKKAQYKILYAKVDEYIKKIEAERQRTPDPEFK